METGGQIYALRVKNREHALNGRLIGPHCRPGRFGKEEILRRPIGYRNLSLVFANHQIFFVLLRIFSYETEVPRFLYIVAVSHNSNVCVFVLLLAERRADETGVLKSDAVSVSSDPSH